MAAAHIYRPKTGRSENSLSRLTPIDYRKFEKFLKFIGCRFIRQKGDHRLYRRADLKRPIVFPAIKDIPVFIILSNLHTLGISKEEYLSIIESL
jgi:predicted RNA binding protein YcfA (HicA-like mRNA interferase family)